MTTLYCILAREAETAVIFRRGPTKQVRLISWDLKTHTFTPGQWLKGRIYHRKSDLSPNGRKLVYYAAKHHGELPTWIAVSAPPYLTAQVLWPAVGTWNDLSLFETDSTLAIATYRSDSSIEPHVGFEVPRGLQIKRKPWPGYFYKLADHDRLIRDGWATHDGDPLDNGQSRERPLVIYRKPLSRNGLAFLEMSARDERNFTYSVSDKRGGVIDLEAQWADARGRYIYYSQGGRLLQLRVTSVGTLYGPPEELADFSDMRFEEMEAPDWAKQW